MNRFEQGCIDAKFTQDMKLRRGYGEVYDILFDILGTDISILELGVGSGNSHIRWLHILSNDVIGIEIAGPNKQKCNPSLYTGDPNIVDRQIEIALLAEEQFRSLPKEQTDRLHVYLYTDAYSPETTKMIEQNHGKLKVIVNDAKHSPNCHNLFLSTWQDNITADGLLVQEDIARWVNNNSEEYEEPKAKELVRALETGWNIYQFVDYDLENTGGSANQKASLIGLHYTDSKWDSYLEPLKDRKVTLDNYLMYCSGE